MLPSVVARRERPWVALGTGLLPVIGNFAYPCQILYSSADERARVARFIVQDGGALVGQALPIWGGRDPAAEHRGNRLPDRLLHGWATRGQPSR